MAGTPVRALPFISGTEEDQPNVRQTFVELAQERYPVRLSPVLGVGLGPQTDGKERSGQFLQTPMGSFTFCVGETQIPPMGLAQVSFAERPQPSDQSFCFPFISLGDRQAAQITPPPRNSDNLADATETKK
jgi:hypothetical protein